MRHLHSSGQRNQRSPWTPSSRKMRRYTRDLSSLPARIGSLNVVLQRPLEYDGLEQTWLEPYLVVPQCHDTYNSPT